MKIGELVRWSIEAKETAIDNVTRNRARLLFLDTNFNSAHSWNLANKMIQHVWQFGSLPGYDHDQVIN